MSRIIRTPKPELVSPQPGGRPSESPSAPSDERIATVALSRPLHVRHAAAALYNDSRKRWGKDLNAAQVRALAQVLSLSRQVIFDTVVERRIEAMEKRFGLTPPDELEEAESSEDSETPGIS
jgi:hypothetical protein